MCVCVLLILLELLCRGHLLFGIMTREEIEFMIYPRKTITTTMLMRQNQMMKMTTVAVMAMTITTEHNFVCVLY